MPKVVRHSGCCDKHNCLQWDSNLWSCTSQACCIIRQVTPKTQSVCGNYETTSTIPMSTKQPNIVKILLRQTTACRYVDMYVCSLCYLVSGPLNAVVHDGWEWLERAIWNIFIDRISLQPHIKSVNALHILTCHSTLFQHCEKQWQKKLHLTALNQQISFSV